MKKKTNSINIAVLTHNYTKDKMGRARMVFGSGGMNQVAFLDTASFPECLSA